MTSSQICPIVLKKMVSVEDTEFEDFSKTIEDNTPQVVPDDSCHANALKNYTTFSHHINRKLDALRFIVTLDRSDSSQEIASKPSPRKTYGLGLGPIKIPQNMHFEDNKNDNSSSTTEERKGKENNSLAPK
jgi:hypothetical protein